ncbi:hypothetical protein MiYa_03634 [Microcystis aeruginosa NIES-2519]|uniref:Uncharacterized protein n=1 Tax=Microcystis aeruginosa NIES-2519 TaxID=2303981 RepID=A0A5A5RFY0_MICAE|nr:MULTISPECIES: hypothetical protein [Microcystis]GCA72087.1 hypothetical protein MiYa_03634 [Microcystis aeruginosa NIES-2519]
MLFDLVRRHSPTVERLRPRFLTTGRCRDVKHDNLGSVNLHCHHLKLPNSLLNACNDHYHCMDKQLKG